MGTRTVRCERAGSTVHGWVGGAPEGPLVVLLHGATMDHAMFAEQVGPLGEAGYRVLAIDFRGHGASKPIGELPLTMAGLALDVLGMVDLLGVEHFDVVGQSMGGYVAQELVRRHSHRVRAITVIGSTCLTLPITWWERLALRSSPWWFRWWPWDHLLDTMSRATALQPDVRAYARRAAGALDRQEFLAVWRGVVAGIDPDPGYRIEHPLLLVHGDQDRTGNVARRAPAWARREPRCRYEVITGAGHNANQDQPEQFTTLLLEFLDQHAASR